MRQFLLKLFVYTLLILVALEILVRVFHLYSEDPPRYIDEYGVEKRMPHHNGYSVTGNRNQNFSEFDINESGFNSYREFEPSGDKFEIALIGDSFIEGFHQDYYNSIGRKVEKRLGDVEVYEYGYAGYDLANQLHLVSSYNKDFELIDEIILYLKFENDLGRDHYVPDTDRIATLRSPLFQIRDHIKILAYGSKIGILEPIKRLITGKAFQETKAGFQTNTITKLKPEEEAARNQKYLENFKSLVNLYGYDKSKTCLLLDSRTTPKLFLDYLEQNDFCYLDFSKIFMASKKPTILIYDFHWNDHGRDLIAKTISDYLRSKYPSGWKVEKN